MNYNDGQIPSFEKFPGAGAEKERSVPSSEDFEKSFATGVPKFAGERAGGEVPADKYGVANPENNYYGETVKDKNVDAADTDAQELGEEYDAGIADAAALINYGLNAAARQMGVEAVVQAVKGFDASGSEDPIGDFFKYLGVDSPVERAEVQEENVAAQASETAFREGANNPGQRRSVEGAFQALNDMKELISEVEGADPRYQALRDGARSAGKGYFEYAVQGYGVRGLTELFQVLAQQRESVEAAEEAEEAVGAGATEINTDEANNDTINSVGNVDDNIENRERLNPEILQK